MLAALKIIDYGKATIKFPMVKKPSPRKRKVSWSNKLQFLSPSLAHFPKHINRCSLYIFKVRTLREGGSLLGFSFKICSIFRFRFP